MCGGEIEQMSNMLHPNKPNKMTSETRYSHPHSPVFETHHFAPKMSNKRRDASDVDLRLVPGCVSYTNQRGYVYVSSPHASSRVRVICGP